MLDALYRMARARLADRRQAKRYLAPGDHQVIATLALVSQPTDSILAVARDLSANGIMFEVADVPSSKFSPSEDNSLLQIMLALPQTTVTMNVKVIRWEQPSDEVQKNLLAVRIVEIGEADKQVYHKFLGTLKRRLI